MRRATELAIYQKFTPTTAIYPKNKAFEYLIPGLASEAGEVSEAYAKWVRGDYDIPKRNRRLEKELGDCLWMISNICMELTDEGYPTDMETLMEINTSKLSKRKSDGTIKGDGEDRVAK